jgi:uncharacterized protein (DUF305 family)
LSAIANEFGADFSLTFSLLNMHPNRLPLYIISTMILMQASISACADTRSTTPSVIAQGGNSHEGMNHGGMKHDLDLGKADANYDLRFIDSMVVHHQGAVVMAKEVLAKSKRAELIKLAKNIISAQDREISQMQQWRKTWYPKAAKTPIMWHAAMNHEMPMTDEYQKMMRMDMSLGKADDRFDLRFLQAMVAHHQGAVTMGQDLLTKSQRPQMQKLAKNIISSQQREIDTMKQWEKQWYPNR